MKTGSVFMFYCAFRGGAPLELLFPGLMRRFTLQTGFAILSMLMVCCASPRGAAAQNAQPDDAPSPAVAATAHDSDAPAQQSSADAPPTPPATEPESDDVLTLFPHSETSRYWISGQANIILQWHGRFPAAYSGTNSFKPVQENATSKVYTLFLGYELTHTAEVFLDVESSGGRGLSEALGLAGFTNLDVVRNPNLGSTPYIARVQLHQTIGLTDTLTESSRTPFSLATRVPVRRIEFHVGKMSLPDYLDINSVGSDSHLQ